MAIRCSEPAAPVRVARTVQRVAAPLAGSLRNPGRSRWWWLPAAVYTAGLLTVALLAAVAEPGSWDRWLDWASTDLDNLGRNPVGSMLLSAFVAESDQLAWLGFSLVGLGAAAHRLGPWRATALVAVAHVTGTLVSQGVLAWRLRAGLAGQAERFALDVGPSYVVVAALVAGLLVSRSWWRLLCALGLGLLSPYLFVGLSTGQVAAVGHTVAAAVGALGAAAAVVIDNRRSHG